MIDKLDLRLTADCELLPFAQAILRQERPSQFHVSKNYQSVVDLRRLGYPCIIHYRSSRPPYGRHKLELVNIGRRSIATTMQEAQQLLARDIWQLPIMRIDLAVDVPNISVSTIYKAVRVVHKGAFHTYGSGEQIESLQYGKGNLIRIYDKVAQLRREHRKHQRARATPYQQTFAEYASLAATDVLTRIERQYLGRRIPAEWLNVVQVRRLAPQIRPFDSLRFTFPEEEPIVWEGRGVDPFTEIGLNWYRAHHGAHALHRRIKSQSHGQPQRMMKGFPNVFHIADARSLLDSSRLQEMFCASLLRHLQLDNGESTAALASSQPT